MSVGLLDVNVLVALAWPSHIHHRHAHNWFLKNSSGGWATCPVTQSGFVRVSSNPAIISDAVTPSDAMSLLGEMTSQKNHVFWPDSIELTGSDVIPEEMISGHRQVTDAYLLGLAAANNGTLVTLDRGISSLIPAGSRLCTCLEIISAD